MQADASRKTTITAVIGRTDKVKTCRDRAFVRRRSAGYERKKNDDDTPLPRGTGRSLDRHTRDGSQTNTEGEAYDRGLHFLDPPRDDVRRLRPVPGRAGYPGTPARHLLHGELSLPLHDLHPAYADVLDEHADQHPGG